MKAADNINNRRMSVILWYCAVAALYYFIGLHFYFSSKGTLLSSAVAAAFGALVSAALRWPGQRQFIVTLISPFVFVLIFYLSAPTPMTLLLALAIISLCLILWTSLTSLTTLPSGGRGELSALLKSASETHLLCHHRILFRAWATAGLLAVLLGSLVDNSLAAFVMPAAIAIALRSVVNSPQAKEFK